MKNEEKWKKEEEVDGIDMVILINGEDLSFHLNRIHEGDFYGS